MEKYVLLNCKLPPLALFTFPGPKMASAKANVERNRPTRVAYHFVRIFILHGNDARCSVVTMFVCAFSCAHRKSDF